MSKRVDDLLQEWVRLNTALSAAHDALRDAALEEYPYKVGDTIAIIGGQFSGPGRKIGKITRIGFKVRPSYRKDDPFKIEVTPYAYPIKKDGTTAKVGEMHPWYQDKVELIEAAK